ncbi:glutamyl-tRNA(Gln) amidotransferase subunit HER2 [Lachancea thermotolerans CBS 6340]|uniref:Glutamyl-tRNA(Gln) amidotransferase subunit A, mitochondrial n=1 Tax=Lachancea thermotolerans (strain ATCC 56472 / CBS 6340 / NRRL Y-8284) TaxID=559295 RepID=C5DD85_LACTC|nr:KLTH0B09152p [Lachancea thermotolerans CBS 6340]CAR21746.1 KLTH0B09152p [Lachancea thermotolerans CBS 6340]
MSFKSAISRLEKLPLIQKQYNAFTHLNPNCKELLIKDVSSSPKKSLTNLLYGIKDNIATSDMPTSCGSKVLHNYQSPFDATIVELLESAGAISVGKTNLDEFGMGSGGLFSHFGPTKNPLFPFQDTVVGGSSSGSAAAVAADAVDFSIGTDTGGSVRLPAAYTSLFGFKPSYGRISRFGVIAYAQSMDTVGIFSKNVSIIKSVFDVLDKHDKKDPTSLSENLRGKLRQLSSPQSSYKIGIPQELLQDNMPLELQDGFLLALEKLEANGHEIYGVSIPQMVNSLPIYYTLAPAEAASNLARFDGLRYGYRDDVADSRDDTLFAPTRSAFGDEVKSRIVLGNYNLCSESFNNHYIKAQRLRVDLINEFDNTFTHPNILTGFPGNQNGVDFLISFSSINLPPAMSDYDSDCTSNPTNSYVNDVFTTPMSLAGLPAINVPVMASNPIGIQLVGQYGDDSRLLDLAAELL